MNSDVESLWLQNLDCVKACPALLAPLRAGGFEREYDPFTRLDHSRKVKQVARYQFPNSREAYVFSIQAAPQHGRWYAWGDYCPHGRVASDACYQFLDGGGSFDNYHAAVWAIHSYIAYLAEDDAQRAIQSTPAFAKA